MKLRRLAVRENLPMPDFLGIGAQKSGTTWLHANLIRHPNLFLPEEKEIHYFDRTSRINIKNLREYCERFELAADRAKGEITPAYGNLDPKRIALIKALNPQLRVILLLRNPLERAWSQAVMQLATRRNRSISSVSVAEVSEFLMSRESRQRGDYVAIIDNWLAVFPRPQLYVGFYDDIRDEPRRLLTDVFTFLGVTTDVDWSRFPVNHVIVPNVRMRANETPFGEILPDATGRNERYDAPPDEIRQLMNGLFSSQLEVLAKRVGDRVWTWRERAYD